MDALTGEEKQREFRELFDTYYQAIFYFFLRRGCPPEQSHDLTQETFVHAYQGLDGFRGQASRQTWLRRIARNLWLNHRRFETAGKRQGAAVSLESSVHPTSDFESEPVALQLPSREPDPEGQLLRNEETARLRQSLDLLPPQMRRCLVLRLRDDLKYREIGETLGISVQTVKSQLFQGRQRLRQLLADGGRK